ncbi:unnamed protein product [Moneuplotes crassus]|uniref:Uncharacterized protein n=1 Tax=Euplotes crassus TaxID=5936 RepID=A0AAD1XTK3_EUPCR|nr:unnamed protein product [Moneuplotes crassus]
MSYINLSTLAKPQDMKKYCLKKDMTMTKRSSIILLGTQNEQKKFLRSKIGSQYQPPMLPIMMRNMNYSSKELDMKLQMLKKHERISSKSSIRQRHKRPKSMTLSRHHTRKLTHSEPEQPKMVSLLYTMKRKEFITEKTRRMNKSMRYCKKILSKMPGIIAIPELKKRLLLAKKKTIQRSISHDIHQKMKSEWNHINLSKIIDNDIMIRNKLLRKLKIERKPIVK